MANGTAVFQSSVVRDLGPSVSSTIDQLDSITITNTGSDKELATPWYSDQILPFDITLTGANEYGAMCAAKIFGVEILNEGSGISVDDAVTEMSATFVARTVEPMSAVPSPFQPRVFRPLPCFGTIGKHYRKCRKYPCIALSMNYLQDSGSGRKRPFLFPRPAATLQAASKTAPHLPGRAKNCATGTGVPSVSAPGTSRQSVWNNPHRPPQLRRRSHAIDPAP